ncbi:hypothetical protein [Halorubellus salinus]|uniref:hypothetical protein n=1 Tax=Halorubellus salinus TaxID=755309 RepID=UPI001D060D6A|nr:hypothetical protein [Halorubellus salinus]
MPEIRLELSAEDVRKLDTEVDLLGFEDRGEYLRWIIGNRAAIEQGTERDQLLTEYQARVDELEAQLSARDEERGGDGGAAAGGVGEPEPAAVTEGDAGRARATDGSGARTTAESSSTPADPQPGAESASTTTPAEPRTTADPQAAGDVDETASDGASRQRPSRSDDAGDEANEAVDIAGNFAPERVERFEDESLGSHANQLKGVEGERLDEFARRAVAKTRERLGREPSTGLEYRSGTRIARSSPDVRPGEDLVDLDSLDVPGRSESTSAPRREAVGAALAYLRDVDRAKRSDFVDELYAEYPAGYDSESGWWRCIKRGLKDAPVVDGGDGSRVWTYVAPGSREGELVGSGPKRVVDPE